MNYAFVETAQAEFDPTAFQLPESLQAAQGPENLNSLPVMPQIQQLEKQFERELKRVTQVPSEGNQQVSQNLKEKLQVNASDVRAEQVKSLLLKLKSLSAEGDLNVLRSALIVNIEHLQTCYRGEQIPKDLATMSVLHPLLKCQAAKWDALKASRPLEIPAPEISYVQKLRQLKGGLGPVERAALMQWVMAFNQHVPKFEVKFETNPAASVEASRSDAIQTDPAQTVLTALPEIAPLSVSETVFDPLQASRLLMQLRAKLQRTFSAHEKQDLHAQIQSLEAQQKSFFEKRQIQALQKQAHEFQSDQTRFEQSKFTLQIFESWRKLRLTSLQNMGRLFAQDASKQAFAGRFESGQKQVARLGMADAKDWIANERKSHPLESVNESGLHQALLAWQQSFEQMIDQALGFMQTLGAQAQAAEFKAQLKAIEMARAGIEAQQSQIQKLEAEYLLQDDPVKAHQLKQTALQLYAELLAQLPKPPDV